MKLNADKVSKFLIIKYIKSLISVTDDINISINVSVGGVINIKDNIIKVSNNNEIYVIPTESLKKVDLLIILRYLENLKNCRDIIHNTAIYEKTYDLRKNRWREIPLNEKEVDNNIKKYLSKKKNIAFIDKRYPPDPNINKVGKYLKFKLSKISEKYKRKIDILYDFNENNYIILIDKYDENEFGLNILHIMSELIFRFNINCCAYTYNDYNKIENKKILKF